MSGTMEGLLSFQEVAKNHELPEEVLDFDITSLEKYFDEKSLRVIMEKICFSPFK